MRTKKKIFVKGTMKMSKIKIITDSGRDISLETAQKLGIRILPISFTFDGETYYRENIDMTKEEFYEKLADKNAPIPKKLVKSLGMGVYYTILLNYKEN